jgi:subtilisin family serine protease
MNVPTGWANGGSGQGVTVGIIDTGVIGTQSDLSGKVDPGFNERKGSGNGNTDQTPGTNPFYHGTFVSTCSMANTNNGVLGAAPAYLANIIPVNVFNTSSTTSDADIINALFYLEGRNVKLINLSVNANTPNTFANSRVHPALTTALADFYNNHNGLLFNAAGNDAGNDTNPRTNNLIVISAVTSASKLSTFSTYGSPVWFAAPGTNIVSGDGSNKLTTASGTSFASPLAMSVAAQIWGLRPNLTNAQVLNIMQTTATKPSGYTAAKFGYGIVNSGAAVQKALTF